MVTALLLNVQETPASTRLVYATLQADGVLTPDEQIARTGVSRRTLADALRTLRDRDPVETRPHEDDHRRRRYALAQRDD